MKRRYRVPPPAVLPVYVTGQVIELHAEDDRYPSNGTTEAVWIEPKMTIIELHAEDEQIAPAIPAGCLRRRSGSSKLRRSCESTHFIALRRLPEFHFVAFR